MSREYQEEKAHVPGMNSKKVAQELYRKKWKSQLQHNKLRRHPEKEKETKTEEREEES